MISLVAQLNGQGAWPAPNSFAPTLKMRYAAIAATTCRPIIDAEQQLHNRAASCCKQFRVVSA
eukprot:14897638-Alexandrium_andersonii.AAC.1